MHRPGEADATSEQLRVGVVSFFGVEHSTKRGSKSPQPLSYTFDITDAIQQLGAQGDLDDLAVSLIPIEGMVEESGAAAPVPPPVNILTVAVLTS